MLPRALGRVAIYANAQAAILQTTRMSPAHKRVSRKEQADRWVELAADEPDAHGVGFLGHGDRYGNPSPRPGPSFRVQCSITEIERQEVKAWADVRATQKYRCSRTPARPRRTGGLPRGSTGGSRATVAAANTSRPASSPTRERLFENCPQWKRQQKIL
jgi:hypothetical protein